MDFSGEITEEVMINSRYRSSDTGSVMHVPTAQSAGRQGKGQISTGGFTAAQTPKINA